MAIDVGQVAPDFTLLDQDSNPVTLSELKGKRHYFIFTLEQAHQAALYRLKVYVTLR